ncbi:hypothetical protein MTR67_048318, partial [Solanum verrucosum]
GCDASILFDETHTLFNEKTALPNLGSTRGYGIVEDAKREVEKTCPGVVSCADILAVAARDASTLVSIPSLKLNYYYFYTIKKDVSSNTNQHYVNNNHVGGPSWTVKFRRRDSTTASHTLAETDLPSPFDPLDRLISGFAKKGLSTRDMVPLSGSHSIGQAQCFLFRDRIYSNGTDIDAGFASTRRRRCPQEDQNGNLDPLDVVTPNQLDNNYFKNLRQKKDRLQSDQVILSGGSTDDIVLEYSNSTHIFASDFAAAMVHSWIVKLGRRDSTTANHTLTEPDLLGPFDPLDRLISGFAKKGLSTRNMVVLSGSHSISQAQCFLFHDRIYSNGTDIDVGFASTRRRRCPQEDQNGNLAPLDLVTPNQLDNNYFKNLRQKKGLLQSDQVLLGSGSTNDIVLEYNNSPRTFASDFAAAMVRMGDISPLTG